MGDDERMCGITGWVEWNKNMVDERKTLQNMTNTLKRRGPDACNIWTSKHIGLGHTRLIVVDPAGGAQPMHRKLNEQLYTICYNGELYNTEDLRKELVEEGFHFRSHSDTEVLLTSYMAWGEECVNKLNGIFAFAIWDDARKQLFMARDRLGVKPLFYTQFNNKLLFASELKALLAHPEVKPEVDQDGIAEIFGLGPSRTPGHGIFRGINELRPGYKLCYGSNKLEIKQYWSLQSRPHLDSLKETIEKVRFLLQDAVKRQLVADVPICTFLSGGVDSSGISAIAAKALQAKGKKLHTYSIDYEDNSKYFKASDFQPNQDAPWIEKVSKDLGTLHHSCVIDNHALAGLLKEAVYTRDLPGMADIDSSLLWFCQKVREERTVALSGECADEIFGGYPWFHKEELMHLDHFPWMQSTSERERLLAPEWRKKLNLQEYVQYRYQETLKEVPRLDGESKQDARRRELFYLNKIWFMTTLLDRKDRMSMGSSLEVRVPFADHRIVEYVWNIPWEMKMVDGREKGLLRRSFKGLLSDDVLYRKKSPYPKTHHPAYTKAVREWLLDILEDGSSPIRQFINLERVRDIALSDGKSFSIPWFGQLMTGPQLLAHLAQIDTWLRKYEVKVV